MVYDGDGKVTVAAKSIEIGELIWSHISQVGRPGLWQSVDGGNKEENLGWLHATEEFKCAKNIGKKQRACSVHYKNYVLDQQLLSACTYFADKNTDAGNDNLRYFSLILIPQ